MNDQLKKDAFEFVDKYSIYLPKDKAVHEKFGEELGGLLARAMNAAFDKSAQIVEKEILKYK